MLDSTLNIFRAIGEETRLRIMVLLSRGELTVTELTQILGQSQPRVSRHLKILSDAGMVERYREGSWVFYRSADNAAVGEAAQAGVEAVDAMLASLRGSKDRIIARDGDRFEQSRHARAAAAEAYFEANAAEWDQVRRLHLPDSDIEEKMGALLGDEAVDLFVDIGVGSGRMLVLFADLYRQGIGFDTSREMLSVARAALEREGVAHAQVRYGDLFSLPIDAGTADIVCIHQVLHFLADPGAAVRETAKLLRPGGRLLLSDFAPHELEFLREAHAHRRLGFADDEVRSWCNASGLTMREVVALSPGAKDTEQLTVKIWLCEAPQKVRALDATLIA